MSAAQQMLKGSRNHYPHATAWIIVALLACVAAVPRAQGGRTVRDSVFSDAQAVRGQAVYDKQCASCHGDKLEGSQGPPLTGAEFLSHWYKAPLSELASKIHNTMPADSPGVLTAQQSADL